MRSRRALAAGALVALGATAAAAQGWRTVTSARQLSGEQRLAVKVEYGAGRLRLAPATGDLLYRMQLRYDERVTEPVTEYDRGTGHLRLGVTGTGRRRGGNTETAGRAEIALSPRVPTRLELAFGAGEADVQLGGMALESLHLSTGASQARIAFDRPNRVEARSVRLEAGAAEVTVTGLANARAERIEFEGGVGGTTLDFGGTWARSTEASVKVGMGSVTLRLPRGLGVRLRRQSFLASFETPGFTRRGDYWYTPTYDRAAVKLDLRVEAAMGSVQIEWI